MTQINFLLPAPLVEALGWTLLHSLWQGAVLALLLLLLLFSMRKSTAQKRYLLAVATLLLFLGSSFGTFVWSYQKAQAQAEAALSSDLVFTHIVWEELPTDLTAEAAPQTSRWEMWQAYFEQHSPWIVSAWLLGVSLLALRFLGGIVYLQRLRHRQNQPVAAFWQERMVLLSQQLGLRRKVQLLESALVQVPMVIGALKPVILLPLGLLSGLPATQVEAVLVHELAHIRRHDYLINLLQSLVEILFFFNPLVWWMAAKIRQERENCCDDEALRITGDALAFAKILLHLEASRLQQPALAMALAGQKGALQQRIARMLGQKSRGAGLSGGFWAATVLLLCLGLAFYQGKALEREDALGLEETSAVSPSEGLEVAPEATTQRMQKPALPEKKVSGDTLFFGKNFKYKIIFSDAFKGEMDFYDGDTKVKKEDYHLYKDFFTVNEDGSIRFAPKMGTIRYSKGPKQKAPLVFPYEGPFIDSLYGMKFTPFELFPNDSLFQMKFTPLELPSETLKMLESFRQYHPDSTPYRIRRYNGTNYYYYPDSEAFKNMKKEDLKTYQKFFGTDEKSLKGWAEMMDAAQAQNLALKEMERARKELEKAEKEIAQTKQSLAAQKQDKEVQKEIKRAQKELEKAEKEIQRAKKEIEKAKEEMQQSIKDREQAEKDQKEFEDFVWKQAVEETNKDIERNKKEIELRRKLAEQEIEYNKKEIERGKQEIEQEIELNKQQIERNKKENDLLWKELQEELIKDGYLKNKREKMRLEIGVGNAIRVNKQVLSPAHEAKYLKKFPQIMTYETKSEKWAEKDSSYAIDDAFWEEVKKDLVRDGYLKNNKSKVTINVANKITVNGKALSAADQARYLKKFPQLQP